MKYIAIEPFSDLQDNGYRYQAGDEFPRKGFTATSKRLEELLTDKNRRQRPMIKAVEELTKKVVEDDLKQLEVPVSKKGKKKKNAE